MSIDVYGVLTHLANAGLSWLQAVFASYGLIAFMMASLLKGLMLFVIIPAESVTPVYVLLTADSEIQVLMIAGIAAVFVLLGNTVIYLLARRLGETFVLYRRYKGTRKWEAMETMFKRYGRMSVFALRLIPVIGGWVSIPAGIVRFNMRDFIIFSFFGFFTYEAILGSAAFYGVRMGEIIHYETFAPLIDLIHSII